MGRSFDLQDVLQRPAPFECSTVRELWTDEHISKKMLEHHLDGSSDLSSRNSGFIERSAAWLIERFGLSAGTSVGDFGCGPGLYTTRFARSGAEVTGIDFSERSLRYAAEGAAREGLAIDYVETDYLTFQSASRFDLITMIACDFCALGPQKRQVLLEVFHRHLVPGGHLVLDVYSLAAFEERIEQCMYEPDLHDGLFSSEPYDGFLSTFVYGDEKVVLDKYTIVQKQRGRTIYNWFQHFSPESLTREMAGVGFTVTDVLGDVAGSAFDPDGQEFAIVARR